MDAPRTSPPFRWNKPRLEAAQLLAEDELTDDEIAQKISVDRKTLYNWRQHPDFTARIKGLVDELGNASRRYAIAHRNRRVRWLNDRVERMHSVIRDRAADPTMADVPGGPSGLMVRQVKVVGGGDQARVVEEYYVDTALLKELREHEKQAAQELGQWVEKKEVDGDLTLAVVEEIVDGDVGSQGDSAAPGTGEVPPE